MIDPVARFPSLVALLKARAGESPQIPAYTYLDEDGTEVETWTFADLDARARSMAVSLAESGLKGQRCLMIFPPGLHFLAAYFACLYAGVIAVPAYPPRLDRNMARLMAIAADSGPAAVLTTEQIFSLAKALFPSMPQMAQLKWITSDTLPLDRAAEWEDPRPSPNSLAFLQYTSGSTSAPKGVMVTHGNLIHNVHYISTGLKADADDLTLSWLPHYHDMGLIGATLSPMYLNHRAILMSPFAFLKRPKMFLEAMTRYRATVGPFPNFAFDLCVRKVGPEDRKDLDLRSWRIATNGSEPIRADSLDRFAAAFGPCGFRMKTFAPVYGLAEATLMVTGTDPDDDPTFITIDRDALELEGRVVPIHSNDPKARRLVGSGKAGMGTIVTIVDPHTLETLGDGCVGEVWVQGPSVTPGYWNNTAATEATFNGRTKNGAGPYLRTGDLGFTLNNELFISGREKDLIIVRGRNYYPQDIEAVAEIAHGHLRAGCTAAFSVEHDGDEALVVVIEIVKGIESPDLAGAAAAVAAAVSKELGIVPVDVAIIATDTILKTSSGKIQRQATKAGYLTGKLKRLNPPG